MKNRTTHLRTKYLKARRLKLNSLPPLDMKEGEIKSSEERILNVKKRMEHLAEILEHLKNIYDKNKDLYDDRFLAFVGYYVIRNWPDKDFPFFSEKAKKELGINKAEFSLTGMSRSELSGKIGKDNIQKLRYEHWTPLSFFRDAFDNEEKLTKKDFYELLCDFYRVVYITKQEDSALNKKYKSSRPLSAYEELNIIIEEKKLWSLLEQ